jgi:recombinational DNA repair protein (RecF pathway)
MTVTSVHLIETLYPPRTDYTRLTCGTWLLSLAEAAAEPEQE